MPYQRLVDIAVHEVEGPRALVCGGARDLHLVSHGTHLAFGGRAVSKAGTPCATSSVEACAMLKSLSGFVVATIAALELGFQQLARHKVNGQADRQGAFKGS